MLGLNRGALAASDFLGLFYDLLGSLDAPLVFLAGDHLLEQAIFRVGNFVLGILNFTLEGFEGFVGLDLVGLIPISLGFVLPALDVQFEFLALLEGFELGRFAGGEFGDFKPGLVVSGINHGANLGDDITYSGTVAAALEGVVLGLPAIAVSQQSRGRSLDFRYDGGFDFGDGVRNSGDASAQIEQVVVYVLQVQQSLDDLFHGRMILTP